MDSNPASGRRINFRVTQECGRYAVTFRRHWPLITSIGLFFGWLLSFPMQGPLFGALVQNAGIEPIPLTVSFLLSHFLGLALGGISGYFFKRFLAWFSLGAFPCLVISLLIENLSAESWQMCFGIMGLFSGLVVIGWGTSFTGSVASDERGRTFIMSAVMANLILYFIITGTRAIGSGSMLIATGLLTASMPILMLYRSLNSRPENTERAGIKLKTEKNSLRFWLVLPFILSIYAVGGLMYHVVSNLASPPSNLLSWYGLIPYIILLFFAGSLADIAGRRIIAILGAIAVGIGFMSVGLLRGSQQYMAIQTFLVGGYAFLDTFTWVIVADLSSRRNAPLVYSIILGTNILAIMIGVLLGEKIGILASGSETLTVSISGLFSFVSLMFVIKLKDTLKPNSSFNQNSRPVSLTELSQRVSLTPRELDVAILLLNGASTEEIRGKLVIAPDTLKSHLRNIYRKAGVRNRLEFTLAVLKDTPHNGERPETSAQSED